MAATKTLRSRRSTSSQASNGTIRVVAPATLAEGYTFEVEIGGRAVRVTVPEGGVHEGETFEFTAPSSSAAVTEDASTIVAQEDPASEETDNGALVMKVTASSSSDADDTTTFHKDSSLGTPKGRWRRPLCACFDVLTQATFWMAFCCLPVLLGQLLTRFGLDYQGRPASSPAEASLTFNRIVLTFIAVLVVGNLTSTGFVAAYIYTLVLMVWTGRNLRRALRQRYAIPPVCGERADDCLCMLACGCCATIQMARHTHDDKEYPGYCCTTTGLDLEAPVIV
jgi:Cys-rich protein (TIGR01571 family)